MRCASARTPSAGRFVRMCGPLRVLHGQRWHDGPVTDSASSPPRPSRSGGTRGNSRTRMTGKERREQLLDIGRSLFAEKGFEGTSVEEIAAKAGVSKPVVYEHFGGKEGLYAVVVDREVESLLGTITGAL